MGTWRALVITVSALVFKTAFPLFSVALVIAAVLHWHERDQDPHVAALVALACLLPNILGYVAAHLTSAARDLDMPRPNAPDAQPPILETRRFGADEWSIAREAMRSEWSRTLRISRHADLHARIWGFLGTLTISACAMVLATDGARAEGLAVSVAAAAAAAAAISSLLGFAQVLVRSAAHDASTRMFSCASRDLVTSVVVGVLATFLLSGSGHVPALVLGLTAGLFGPRALDPLKQRAASVLGVKLVQDSPQPLSFTMIDGLTEDVGTRLAEEGLDSVHALAFTSTPRLYFSTPYSWERIADWQAQAVLLEELGLARFAKFKEQFPIRSVQDAIDMLDDKDFVESVAQQFPQLKSVVKALRSSQLLKMPAFYSMYGDWLIGEILASGELDSIAPPSHQAVPRKGGSVRPPPSALDSAAQ
jgi:hypothetical protein